jgi:hypothetical protein
MYAGAYAFGRRPHERVRPATGIRTRPGKWVPMERWKVLKHDCLPAYVTWTTPSTPRRVVTTLTIGPRSTAEIFRKSILHKDFSSLPAMELRL